MITARDEMKRPLKAVTVTYKQAAVKPGMINNNPVIYETGDEEITFAYVEGKRTIKERVKLRERGPSR
jgi:hypothetical protein